MALLRASAARGTAAVHGVIELPLDRLASMTGFIEASDIGRLLTAQALRMSRSWKTARSVHSVSSTCSVSAFVPTATTAAARKTVRRRIWIPLAPALDRGIAFSGGNDLVAAAAIDTNAPSLPTASRRQTPSCRSNVCVRISTRHWPGRVGLRPLPTQPQCRGAVAGPAAGQPAGTVDRPDLGAGAAAGCADAATDRASVTATRMRPTPTAKCACSCLISRSDA